MRRRPRPAPSRKIPASAPTPLTAHKEVLCATGMAEAAVEDGPKTLTDRFAVCGLPFNVRVAGVIVQVAPAGIPVPHASVTVPANPRIDDAVKVDVPVDPAGMSNVGGVALTAKSGDCTLMVTGAVVAGAKSWAPSKYAVITLIPVGRFARRL